MLVRVATSLSFSLSIPPRWAVKEMLRVFDTLELEEKDWYNKAPLGRVETGIIELLTRNTIIRSRDVYGLMAIALLNAGLLKNAESLACSLYALKPGQKRLAVIADNHRLFRIDGVHILDPQFKILEARGSTPERSDFYIIAPYPQSVAEAVMDFVLPKVPARSPFVVDDDDYSWFIQVVRRLAARQNLPPAWWAQKDNRSIISKTGFEGLMRAMVPSFIRRSERWRDLLLQAMRALFPAWDPESAKNFVRRLEDEFGPIVPRDHGKDPVMPVLVDPAASFNFNGRNPIIQPPNDGLSNRFWY